MEMTEEKLFTIVAMAMEKVKEKWLEEMRMAARQEIETAISDLIRATFHGKGGNVGPE